MKLSKPQVKALAADICQKRIDAWEKKVKEARKDPTVRAQASKAIVAHKTITKLTKQISDIEKAHPAACMGLHRMKKSDVEHFYAKRKVGKIPEEYCHWHNNHPVENEIYLASVDANDLDELRKKVKI